MNIKNRSKLDVILGDITKLDCDAIVNAANSSLLGGGGVDGAIHRAGGPSILSQCKEIISQIGSCKTSQAVITTGGNLPCKKVIHTVGPIWHGGNSNEEESLKNCYINSLKLAEENGLKTIAFPNISTGIYGYPKELAVSTVLTTVDDYLNCSTVEKVIFVCFDKENYQLYNDFIG